MLNEITAIVGKDWVRSDETKSRFAVDQQQPALVIEPGSAEELCEVLKIAHGARRAIVPVGSGTGLWLGNPTEHIDMAVSTRRLNAILEYEPADLTVSVQAGCTLQHLNDTLAQHNQWLPLDPPRPNLATLGAVAAMNEWGPLRLGFGLARDHTIGIVVALAEGTLVKSGGRVVKNVAGYDLIKVFLGSLGTLGVISGLNFKLRARPETDTTCQVSHGDANSVSDFVKAVAGSGLLRSLWNGSRHLRLDVWDFSLRGTTGSCFPVSWTRKRPSDSRSDGFWNSPGLTNWKPTNCPPLSPIPHGIRSGT